MKKIFSVFFIIALLFIFNAAGSDQKQTLDLVISNALVVDGTGKKAYKANLYIGQGKITAIDTTLSPVDDSIKTIQADGRAVTPGFIDLHSHGDPLTDGSFYNYLAMGATTITLGQDGFSPETESLADWKNEVEQKGSGPNIAMFIGHGTLRSLAGIGNTADVTAEQMTQMINTLKKNLPYVFGMSTGLEYAPALFARESELIALAKVVGASAKMIMSHLRNEDDEAIITSIEELLAQGQLARVHIAHLKSVYGKGADRAEEILKVLYEARELGIAVSADVYPYTASYTDVSILFPDWAKTNDQLRQVIKTRRPELEDFIVHKVNARNGPQATLFGTQPYQGKTLKQVAEAMQLPFEQVLIDSIGPEGASAAYFVMNKELQERFITDPLMAISSDGSPTSFHPRGHGTFAKLIEEYVVNNGRLSLEEAIRKITALPASILGLADRGIIKVGKRADLLLFDPARVKAVADYSNPHQLARGFDYVIIDGNIALENGQFSSRRFGRVLTPKEDRNSDPQDSLNKEH